jgi:hypothetical protein
MTNSNQPYLPSSVGPEIAAQVMFPLEQLKRINPDT